MKKVIRLTESDLTRIVKRVIKEQTSSEVDEDMVQQGIEILNREIPRLKKEKRQSRTYDFNVTHYIDKRGEEYIRHEDRSFAFPEGTSGFVLVKQPVGDVLSILGLPPDSEEIEVILKKWLEDNYGFIDPIPIPNFFYQTK